jgi:hypothetical protein
MDAWDKFYETVARETDRGTHELLDRFGVSLGDWLYGSLNWPAPQWRDELYEFVEHSRYYGVELEQASIDRFRELIEARVEGTAPFEELGPYNAQQVAAPAAMPVQLAMAVVVGDGEDADADAEDEQDEESEPSLSDEGLELAGPGPFVSESYKAKVQKVLELLDPKVAQWWKANSVEGQIRSRVTHFWQFGYFSQIEGNGQPFIYVSHTFTASQTAQAIIDEVKESGFANSLAAYYRKYRFGRDPLPEAFREWQRQSVGEAAWFAGVLAEMYVSGIATLTPAGELVVTIDDVAQHGLRWDQLTSILPFLSLLPITAIVIKLGRRRLKISKALSQKLKKLPKKEHKALMAKAKAAKTDEEAVAIIEQGVTAQRSSTDVYTSKKRSGEVQYVGITVEFARRAADHLRKKGIRIEVLMPKLSRSDARAVEQALIELHGLSSKGGTLMNIINSISPRRPDYAKRLERGLELLKSIGYTE